VILQSVYDPLYLPNDMNLDLFDNLLKGSLCKCLMLNMATISCTLVLNL
jgi:hypothetical protein